MWCKRAAAICSAALVALAGCGPGKPAPSRAGVRPAQLSKRLVARDFMPGDLDIVLRVDMARLRAGLGPNVAEAIAARAGDADADGFVSEAMAKADAVWIGLRLSDIDAGDRVIVAEGRLGEIHIDPSQWEETTPTATMESVQILDRLGTAPRAGTGRIVVYEKKLYAFVSPVEVDATTRVLRDGPDEGRGDPTADGLVSADVRGHRLPPSLEKKYPRIGSLIAGVVRVRGSATLGEDGVHVAIDMTTKSALAAERVEKFLTTLRESGAQTRFAPLMSTVKLTRVDTHLLLSATVPAAMIVGALNDANGTTPAP
ncbi:MAG: hypothetical protein U0441_06810 [Polyangiaceae bacterium]